MGQKQTCAAQKRMSALPPEAAYFCRRLGPAPSTDQDDIGSHFPIHGRPACIGQYPNADDVYERDEIDNRPPLTESKSVKDFRYGDAQDYNEKDDNKPLPNTHRTHLSLPRRISRSPNLSVGASHATALKRGKPKQRTRHDNFVAFISAAYRAIDVGPWSNTH